MFAPYQRFYSSYYPKIPTPENGTTNGLNSTDFASMNKTITNSSTICITPSSIHQSDHAESVIILVIIIIALFMMTALLATGQRSQSAQNRFLNGSMNSVSGPTVVDHATDLPPTYITCVLRDLDLKGGSNETTSTSNTNEQTATT